MPEEGRRAKREERNGMPLRFSLSAVRASPVFHRASLRVFAVCTLLIFFVVALLPVAVVLAQSVWTEGRVSLAAYRSVLSQARQWSLLGNTLAIAFGVSVVATLLGAPVAFAIEYFRVPTRRWLAYAAAIPLLIPPYVSAIVWVDALGRRGILRFGLDAAQAGNGLSTAILTVTGVIAVLALSYFPVVTLTTAAALRRYDPRVEEPARLVANVRTVFRRVTLPLAAPGIVSGTLIVFVLALVEFAVPSLLQVNVYAVEIYSRFSATYDSASAAAQATPLLLCGSVALLAWIAYIRPRQGRLTGRGRTTPVPRKQSSIVNRQSSIACWCLIAVATIVPMALLFWRSLPVSSYVEVWKTARNEVGASLLLAALSATVLTVLALAMAYLGRVRHRLARAYALSLLPFLVSGPLLGIGLILVWNRPGPAAWVYDTPVVLVLACAARYLFFAHYALHAALRDLPHKLEEAAAVSGVPWWRQATGILLPLVAPAIIAVWGLSFVFALRELDAAVLVAPPGWTPISVRLFGLMHYGPSRLVAALSVITVAIILIGAGLTATAYQKARRAFDAHD